MEQSPASSDNRPEEPERLPSEQQAEWLPGGSKGGSISPGNFSRPDGVRERKPAETRATGSSQQGDELPEPPGTFRHDPVRARTAGRKGGVPSGTYSNSETKPAKEQHLVQRIARLFKRHRI